MFDNNNNNNGRDNKDNNSSNVKKYLDASRSFSKPRGAYASTIDFCTSTSKSFGKGAVVFAAVATCLSMGAEFVSNTFKKEDTDNNGGNRRFERRSNLETSTRSSGYFNRDRRK